MLESTLRSKAVDVGEFEGQAVAQAIALATSLKCVTLLIYQ